MRILIVVLPLIIVSLPRTGMGNIVTDLNHSDSQPLILTEMPIESQYYQSSIVLQVPPKETTDEASASIAAAKSSVGKQRHAIQSFIALGAFSMMIVTGCLFVMVRRGPRSAVQKALDAENNSSASIQPKAPKASRTKQKRATAQAE